MLFATGKHTRRLALPGDEQHPGRTGKIFPDGSDLPEEYLPLLDWAKARYDSAKGGNDISGGNPVGGIPPQPQEPGSPGRWLDSLFDLEGLGKEYWKDVDPDEFVRQLREGWE
jgi:hypothetical protein